MLVTIISFDVFSILICYFCCGISNQNRLDMKERKSSKKQYQTHQKDIFTNLILYLAPTSMEEGGAVITPLLQSTDSKTNDQSN